MKNANLRFLGRPRSEIWVTELWPKCVDRHGSIGHISAPMGPRLGPTPNERYLKGFSGQMTQKAVI